jgi:hypothetical protein
MSAALAIYLIELLGSLGCIVTILWILASLFFIGAFYLLYLAAKEGDEDMRLEALKILNKYWIFLLLSLFAIIIPSKESMYVMLGAKYLSQSELPAKVEKVISLKMDEYINDITSKSKE